MTFYLSDKVAIMKINKLLKNLLCLFTAMAMIMSMMPVAFATAPENGEIFSEEIIIN